MMKKIPTSALTKTDRRILDEKLLKFLQNVDHSIDRVSAYPSNRMPARTRESVVRRLTRTLKAIRRVMEDLKGGELL